MPADWEADIRGGGRGTRRVRTVKWEGNRECNERVRGVGTWEIREERYEAT